MQSQPFPASRPRRLRRNAGLRRLVSETTLTPADFIAPLFVKEGITDPLPVPSMPGVMQHTVESMLAEVKELRSAGVARMRRGREAGKGAGCMPPAYEPHLR